MHVIIWEFTIRKEFIAQFISAYNSHGDWANLFRRAGGFLGTELLRSPQDSNVFLTIDRWESETCFHEFQKQFDAEYKKLDAQCAGYTFSEKKVGIFSKV